MGYIFWKASNCIYVVLLILESHDLITTRVSIWRFMGVQDFFFFLIFSGMTEVD